MKMPRRELLRILSQAALVAPAAGGVSPLFPFFNPSAQAQGSSPRRFLQIVLRGGWDMVLATDPVPSSSHAKATSGGYAAAYYDPSNGSYVGAPVTVTGKPNLLLGAGISGLANRFAEVPTAFVNGIFVEVTAHELALNYMLSGQLSLSRSKEYPAIVATAADKTGGFPAHVVLGQGVPLSTTAATNPPLHALNTDTLVSMLAGAYGGDFDESTIDAAEALVAALNEEYQKTLSTAAKDGLGAWTSAESGLGPLYEKRYDQRVALDAALRSDFGAGNDNDNFGALLATSFQILKEGMARFLTVSVDGFDTHTNHLLSHLPAMAVVRAAVNGLLIRLQSTSDPDAPSKKLIETTTVLICSEFNRTPTFNAASGTDHWQTGAAIVLGHGVRDNTVIGSTDATGNAADYNGGKLLPDHLCASLLRVLGFKAEADAISEVHLSAFT